MCPPPPLYPVKKRGVRTMGYKLWNWPQIISISSFFNKKLKKKISVILCSNIFIPIIFPHFLNCSFWDKNYEISFQMHFNFKLHQCKCRQNQADSLNNVKINMVQIKKISKVSENFQRNWEFWKICWCKYNKVPKFKFPEWKYLQN